MERLRMALLLGCALAGPAAAQSTGTLGAPDFTIHPQGALPTFAGDSVEVVVGWRPVVGATAYRVTLTDASGHATSNETTELRWQKQQLAPGSYQLTIAALDRTGAVGPASEILPINVIEVRAVPPGGDRPAPPTRGAYAVGTRFSVAGMHCEFGDAPIDDLIAGGPENEARMPVAGIALLRCAGLPGYLEKQVVIAPVRVATPSPRVARGRTTTITLTLASVASLGERLDVEAIGDITLGEAQRTEFGLEVPVTATGEAQAATLSVQSAGFELGRVALELVDAPSSPGPSSAPPPPLSPLDFNALDLGGFVGLFSPPASETSGTTLGHPSQRADIITGGPLVGLRLGYFPVSRVGLVGETSLVAGGYVDEANISQILAARGSLEVRALERGSLGFRVFAGAGALRTLKTRGTSHPATDTELHAGAAATIETSPNLWLRIQISDVVTTARDDGYAHCLELQLSVMTRLGRRDSF